MYCPNTQQYAMASLTLFLVLYSARIRLVVVILVFSIYDHFPSRSRPCKNPQQMADPVPQYLLSTHPVLVFDLTNYG